MRQDAIFDQLFQPLPVLLFDLLLVPPENAEHYRFDSVAVGALSLPVLEDLSEALLEFQSVNDLERWLAEHC